MLRRTPRSPPTEQLVHDTTLFRSEEEQSEIDGGVLGDPFGSEDRPRKFYVDGVEVRVLSKRVQYLGPDGKLLTESLRSYAKKTLQKDYKTLDEFLRRWGEAEKKQVIIEALESLGVSLDGLRDEVKNGEIGRAACRERVCQYV